MGDIALPNINYEHQWQQQKLNKTFQQELEQLKQEVYHEGLQVEEEGLTDIIRKKTKLPPDTNPISSNNEPSKNDAIIAVKCCECSFYKGHTHTVFHTRPNTIFIKIFCQFPSIRSQTMCQSYHMQRNRPNHTMEV